MIIRYFRTNYNPLWLWEIDIGRRSWFRILLAILLSTSRSNLKEMNLWWMQSFMFQDNSKNRSVELGELNDHVRFIEHQRFLIPSSLMLNMKVWKETFLSTETTPRCSTLAKSRDIFPLMSQKSSRKLHSTRWCFSLLSQILRRRIMMKRYTIDILEGVDQHS